jgi:nitroreductase
VTAGPGSRLCGAGRCRVEFDDVVRARRSIRSFQAADVPDALLDTLIDCALRAPSSMNGQPWCFIVCRAAASLLFLRAIKSPGAISTILL